eukprot:jgi/Chlat1/5285/Chrsp35S05240
MAAAAATVASAATASSSVASSSSSEFSGARLLVRQRPCCGSRHYAAVVLPSRLVQRRKGIVASANDPFFEPWGESAGWYGKGYGRRNSFGGVAELAAALAPIVGAAAAAARPLVERWLREQVQTAKSQYDRNTSTSTSTSPPNLEDLFRQAWEKGPFSKPGSNNPSYEEMLNTFRKTWETFGTTSAETASTSSSNSQARPSASSTSSARTSSSSSPTSYRYRVEVPGYSREDVRVRVVGNSLTVTANRSSDTIERVEKFTLPQDADGTRAAAQCEHGLVTITVPKKDAGRGGVEVDVL